MEYKRLIVAMITEIENDDVRFLRRIYTLIKMHIEKNETKSRDVKK